MKVININFYFKGFITAFAALLLLPCLNGANIINRTFYNVNDIHGVSLSAANSVCEDGNGFIWISSKTGVLRLTGDDCRTYLLPYETPDIITVNLVYNISGLFAYTNNGQFFKYSSLYDRFELLINLRQLLGTHRLHLYNVLIDTEGTFFIPTTHGLFSYNKQKELVLLTENNKEVRNLAWYDPDHLFVSTEEGITVMHKNTREKELFRFNSTSGTYIVSNLFYDKALDRLWIGTHSGNLIYLSVGGKVIRNVELKNLPRQPILAIEANTDSTIMLGYDGQGLWEMNRSGTKLLNVYREDVDNLSSLRGNGVYDIYKDSNERVWVCTYSGGVSFFEQSMVDVAQIKHVINNSNSLVNNVVNDIFEDPDGNVWFATNNGISRWNVRNNKWDSYLNNETGQARVVLSVFGDSEGKIWAGTWSAGIFVLDGNTGNKVNLYQQELKPKIGDFIFSIVEDSAGDIWIVGVREYVVRYSRKEKIIKNYGYEPVYVIKELNANEMLLGCSYGLVLLNKHTGNQDIILDGYIIKDFIILRQDIWCCTSGGGLIKFNLSNREYKKYTIESGLPSNFVNSIVHVDSYLWLGTENGLCRFNPEKEEVLNYSSIIHLANASFNPGAGYYLSNEHLIYGTNQGAILFNPHTLEPRKPQGQIFIQDIVIAGRTIRDSKVYDLKTPVDSLTELSLSYNQSNITIEMLPKGISAPESKISWKLEGLDNAWSTPTPNRLITFANLPGGQYGLKIRLYNNSLSQLIDERYLIINVHPPFWGTWWFYTLVIMIILGIIYFSYRYHISLIQKQHSEEKIKFFANTAHELRNSLTLINGPVEEIRKEANLSEHSKYYLALAKEQVKNLLNIATQLLDFQKFTIGKGQIKLMEINIVELIKLRLMMFESLADHNQIKLAFQSEVDSCLTAVDIDLMTKVFDNLISNAIKYSHEGGEVSLTFYNDKKNWRLIVKDQGIGISTKGQKQLFKEFYRSENAVNSEIEGSGIGLLMVKKYVEKHNGRVSCTSQENVGSVFKIEVPYLKMGEELSKSKINVNDGINTRVDYRSLLESSLIEGSEDQSDSYILVVENNNNLREFMYVALGEKFRVLSAVNGKEAWEIVRTHLPDLVISDVMMPEMDGFELCRLMKSTYETSHIPVILLTALTEKAEQMHGIGLGADAYLTKPFDIVLLIERINSIITNRKVVRENALRLINHETNVPIIENELNDQFVKKAFEIVELNISNSRFGKDLFASEMNVSSSLLYKKIKSLTDQSPSDFIKSIRLKAAVELLKSRKHNITEVSELCGFSSVGYFSTVFKKYYQKTPSEILEE
ncbi:MAG: response regulator [Bacteroidales bacterium]